MLHTQLVFTKTELEIKEALTFSKVPGKHNMYTCDQLPKHKEIKGKYKGPFIAEFKQQQNRYELGLLTPPDDSIDEEDIVLTPVREAAETPTQAHTHTNVIPGPGGWSDKMDWLGFKQRH